MANKILKIISLIFGLLAGLLICIKEILFIPKFLQLNQTLVEEGSTWEANGVNSGFVYLSIIVSIAIAASLIIGSILTFKENKKGPIIVLIFAVVMVIGYFVMLIDVNFTVGIYMFYINVPLVETMLGIGDPIIALLAGILGLIGLKK